MPRDRIYTKAGDAGDTMLASGGFVRKHSTRIEAYGAVDELNACVGLIRIELARDPRRKGAEVVLDEMDHQLARIQQELFNLGAELATGEPEKVKLCVEDRHVDRLEKELDAWNGPLPPLQSFILPGGGPIGAACHLARTVGRRAERRTVELHEQPFRISVAVDSERSLTTTSSGHPVVCLELGAPLLNPRRPEREVLYEIGRVAAFLRPDRAIRAVYATVAPLALLIDAAMRLGGKDGDSAGRLLESAPGKLAETSNGLRRALPQAALDQVQQLGRALAESGLTGEAAATAWLGYSDLTAVRAGLLLCGDLETAGLLLATDPPGVTPLTPKQRLVDLIHFTVTEEFFTIRQHLGL